MSATHQSLLHRAARLGVPSPITQRAEELIADHGALAQARALLRLTLSLAEGHDVDWAAIEVTEALGRSGERDGMLQLVERAMDDDRDDADVLLALRFVLEQRSPRDPEVQRFVEVGMRRVLDSRRSGQSRRKHFVSADAHATLDALVDVFTQSGGRFFLDRGTLLGAIRDGDFIANDYDIDLGVFDDEISRDALVGMLEATDFDINQVFDHKVGALSPSGIQVDFFLTTREHGYFVSKGSWSIHSWYFAPFDLLEFDFVGHRVWVPDNYEQHLDQNYGNWRTPVIHYDLSYNEPCAVYEPSAAAIEYLSRRMGDALDDGDRDLAQTPAMALQRYFSIDVTDRFAPWRASTTLAEVDPDRRTRSIIVIDDCSVLTHTLGRAITTACSIASVDLAVPVTSRRTEAPFVERVKVAESIDRVRSVVAIEHADDGAFATLLEREPLAIVIADADADADADAEVGWISAHNVRMADDAGISVVGFGDAAQALTLGADGRVTVRMKNEARAQRFEAVLRRSGHSH